MEGMTALESTKDIPGPSGVVISFLDVTVTASVL